MTLGHLRACGTVSPFFGACDLNSIVNIRGHQGGYRPVAGRAITIFVEDPIPAGFITLPEALQRIADCVSEAHVESAKPDFQAMSMPLPKPDVEKGRAATAPDPKGPMRFEVVGGNYRLVAAFDFRRQIVFVKFAGSHAEYDVIDALTVAKF
jgi:HigB_toxin, RelE-like toxic component of a toxin-antitoxin system